MHRAQDYAQFELRTLDSYHFSNVGMIKIDVERHEEAVVPGALETGDRTPRGSVDIGVSHANKAGKAYAPANDAGACG
jgi:hypothetical protein